MSDTQRQEFTKKIKYYKTIIATTDSPYLKRDYQKAVKRMQRELRDYDRFHQSVR